jgi:hypothetical protein
VTTCIEDAVEGLSPECTACYAGVERCSHDSFCRILCQPDTCSQVCLNCVNLANCLQELEECTGIPDDTCGEP